MTIRARRLDQRRTTRRRAALKAQGMPEPPSAHCGLALSADGEDGYRRARTHAVRRRPTKVRLRARPPATRHLSAASRIGTWRSRGRPRRRRRPPPLCQRREPNASSSGRAPAAGCRSDRVLWFVSRRAEPNELSRELSSILGDSPSFPSRRQFALPQGLRPYRIFA